MLRLGEIPQGHFPVELWSQILEEVAFVPGLLDTEIIDSFESEAAISLILSPSRMVVKLSLYTIHAAMLTCRSGYIAALPILYRFIFIENRKQAAAVHSTLRASQAQAQASPDGTAISLGARVQHLMLYFSTKHASVASSSSFWHDLLKIVQSIPNLRILSGINKLSDAMAHDLSQASSYREDLCTMLIRTCKHSLRRLSFDGDADMIVHPHFRSTFVSDFPHLQTITGGGSIINCANAISGNANVTALTVDSTAEPCYKPHDFARPPFPRITTAILRRTALYPHTNSWYHFLAAHGAQLHTVYLDLCAARRPRDRWLLTTWCPQLTTLHLAVRDATDLQFDSVPTFPRALTRLSVYVARRSRDSVAHIFTMAAALAPPALEVLRFANANLARVLREDVRRRVAQGAPPFAGRRVRLEDHRGRDLYLSA